MDARVTMLQSRFSKSCNKNLPSSLTCRPVPVDCYNAQNGRLCTAARCNALQQSTAWVWGAQRTKETDALNGTHGRYSGVVSLGFGAQVEETFSNSKAVELYVWTCRAGTWVGLGCCARGAPGMYHP
eukprot:scaffold28854_cov65-Phaeocystis_antarctica.AAC.5